MSPKVWNHSLSCGLMYPTVLHQNYTLLSHSFSLLRREKIKKKSKRNSFCLSCNTKKKHCLCNVNQVFRQVCAWLYKIHLPVSFQMVIPEGQILSLSLCYSSSMPAFPPVLLIHPPLFFLETCLYWRQMLMLVLMFQDFKAVALPFSQDSCKDPPDGFCNALSSEPFYISLHGKVSFKRLFCFCI